MGFRVMVLPMKNFMVDALEYLCREDNWQIVYTPSSGEAIDRRLRKMNPGIVISNSADEECGVPPSGILRDCAYPIDAETLNEYLYCETNSLKMMDKMASIEVFPYIERIRLYHRLLSFCLDALDRLKPDLVLFPTTPHGNFDYVIYEICKKRAISTVIFEKTAIPNLIYGMRRFEEGFVELKTAFVDAVKSGGKQVALWDESQKYLSGLQGSYENGMPFHLKDRLSRFRVEKPLLFTATKHLGGVVLKGVPPKLELLPGQHPENYGDKSIVDYYMAWLKHEKERRKIRRAYQRLATETDLQKPFIFMALQCQPEKSTSPLGGFFVHQYLAVQLLSHCLPPGWFVYVKEHVSQFSWTKEVNKSKSIGFYKDLISLPNVRLVPLTINAFELIDHARAVAVITGTVGFEAINRGKPVLIFGENWYNGCEGVFEVQTASACRAALKDIEKGVDISMERIRLFVGLLQKFGMRGYNHSIYKKYGNVSPEELRDGYVAHFKRIFSRTITC